MKERAAHAAMSKKKRANRQKAETELKFDKLKNEAASSKAKLVDTKIRTAIDKSKLKTTMKNR
jgi:hypothetical protein